MNDLNKSVFSNSSTRSAPHTPMMLLSRPRLLELHTEDSKLLSLRRDPQLFQVETDLAD